MKHGIRLGRLFGIPIGVHFSWLIIFVIVTASVFSLLPQGYPLGEVLSVAVAGSLLFFSSLIAHELSHSLVARRYDIEVKGITLFIFGGAARIARETRKPSEEAKIAIAGPVASVVIGAVFLGIFAICAGGQSLYSFLMSDEPVGMITTVSGWLCIANIGLAMFNIVPGLPLDGGRLLRSAIWGVSGNYVSATRVVSVIGQTVGFVVVVAGIILLVVTRDWIGGPWLMVVGWFLFGIAPAGYKKLMLQEAAKGFTAGDAMMAVSLVPPQLTLENLVRTYALPTRQRLFVVSNGEIALGIITPANLKQVPHTRWSQTRAEQVMTPAARVLFVQREQTILSILDSILESPLSYVGVIDRGKLVGVISRNGLVVLLRDRSSGSRNAKSAR